MAESDVVRVTKEDAAFDELTPGIAVARGVTESGTTQLGGGWTRFTDGGATLVWHLRYDEVIFVHRGRVSITTSEHTIEAQEGEAIVIRKGTTVTYQGTQGTELFYTLFPANWATLSDEA